jgi:hypothetical protein
VSFTAEAIDVDRTEHRMVIGAVIFLATLGQHVGPLVLVADADDPVADDRGAGHHRVPHGVPSVFRVDLELDAHAERVIIELQRIVPAHFCRRRRAVLTLKAVGRHHRRLELVARNVPHLPGVLRHEFVVQRLSDRCREVVGERAVADFRQLLLYQLEIPVAVLSELSLDVLALGHGRHVLVVDRISVLPPIRFDIREETAVDVEELVVRELDDGVVDRRVFAAWPKPDVRAELVRMAAVVAGPGEAAHTACFSITVTSYPLQVR